MKTLFKKKHKGFSELIILIIIILIAIILGVAFKNKVSTATNTAIENMEDEIENIGSWAST